MFMIYTFYQFSLKTRFKAYFFTYANSSKLRKQKADVWVRSHRLKTRYYALPPIIGCADMPRGAAMHLLPLCMLEDNVVSSYTLSVGIYLTC